VNHATRSLGLAAGAAFLAAGGAAAQVAAEPPAPVPAVTMPGTELRTLHSTATGQDYDIYVLLPNGYARDPAARYPALYVLDGQWDFKLLNSIQGGLVYDRVIPEILVVGITYSGAIPDYNALRAADYTTVPVSRIPGSGGAPKFLAFVRDELIPFIGAHYRADPAPSRRALMGSSYGGLFTLYALFSEPALFGGYVAASPAVSYADRIAFRQEAEYAAAHRDLPARLYIAVGDREELLGPVREFMDVVRGREYRGLRMETRIVEGEGHSGNKPEAYNRGLRFVMGNP
jgi:predicted alpha/beta superfamily hydrolase